MARMVNPDFAPYVSPPSLFRKLCVSSLFWDNHHMGKLHRMPSTVGNPKSYKQMQMLPQHHIERGHHYLRNELSSFN